MFIDQPEQRKPRFKEEKAKVHQQKLDEVVYHLNFKEEK